jgi:hypothetical protein
MPTRATIIAEINALLPDNNAREISPEDTRQRLLDIANEYLHKTDDVALLKLQHNTTKTYVANDVTYYQGDLYQSIAGSLGAFSYADWTLYGSIKDWVTATIFRAGHYVNKGNALYKCLTSHTSGTFATDLAAAKWVLVGTADEFSVIIRSSGVDGHRWKFTVDDTGMLSMPGEDLGV